ncbi:MAG: type I methionyl aminopeptidase, partial [Myxococcales bacterium]|nr:type I methionyl aminopeptidase [Myxococcales bacterium]
SRGSRGSRAGRGPRPSRPEVHDAAGVERMRAAGRLAAEILDRVGEMIGPGVSTAEVDQLVDEITEKNGAVSAPYGYGSPPFPGHCCTSVNDVICHGIPDPSRVLQSGDIVNVDVTPLLDGYHGDSSRTFLIGEVTPVARRLVADTYRALWLGIRAIKPGGRVGDIGHAIQTFIEAQGHSVVREFTGHGIGQVFHTPPAVLHYGRPGEGEVLLPGTTFTIEPMVNIGHWKSEILDDGWTAVTTDGMLSAQWEHTCLLTEEGVEVLTLGPNETPPA